MAVLLTFAAVCFVASDLLSSFYLWCRNGDVSVSFSIPYYFVKIDHDGRLAKDTRRELAGCVLSAYPEKPTKITNSDNETKSSILGLYGSPIISAIQQ